MAVPLNLSTLIVAAAVGKGGKRAILILVLLLAAGGVVYYVTRPGPDTLVLTGIVTTNDVIVSSQITGRIATLPVKEGDTVAPDQVVATIAPEELQADQAYYTNTAEGLASQVRGSEASLRYQQQQTDDQVSQAEATLASINAQRAQAEANLENARLTFQRTGRLAEQGIIPQEQLDQTRTANDAAQAAVDALDKQAAAQRATISLAKSNAEQITLRQTQVQGALHQQAAAAAQQKAASARLGYTQIAAPIGGFVDVLAARTGEVVNPGQAILTLINPDDLWVRADVPETYIGGIRLGEQLTVRLPSGAERQGTVFYRNADASFATQRDVSRTKRDIKTFETRLRVDNSDRALAVGMTAYIVLPIASGK